MTTEGRTETMTVVAPCEFLSANQRLHWSKRAYLTKSWRHAAGWAARAARIYPFATQVDVTVTVHKARAGGRWDPHNLMPTVKAAVDGMVDAKVLRDDSRDYVRRVSIEAGEPRPRNAITLVITEVSADEVAAS